MKKQDKLRIIKDYSKLSGELKEQIKLAYPEGYSQHLIEFTNSKGQVVSALPFELPDRIYLIKMSVKIANQIILDDDDYDDEGFLKILQKNDSKINKPILANYRKWTKTSKLSYYTFSPALLL